MSEREVSYSILGRVGTVVDDQGDRPLIGFESDEKTDFGDIQRDVEEKTGIKFEPVATIYPDGRVSSSFGFSNWRGCTWVPEGPKANWIDPKKSN